MRKLITSILLAFSLMGLVSCSQENKEEDETINIFDPGVPGSNNDGPLVVRPLTNFKACPNLANDNAGCPEASINDTDKITLSWQVNNLYKTEEYVVVIFKIEMDSIFDSEATREQLKNPKDNLAIISYEVGRVKDTFMVDTDVREGYRYLYYGFVLLNGYLNPDMFQSSLGNWSQPAILEVLSTSSGFSYGEPNPAQFWNNKKFSYASSAGSVGGNEDIANLRTFDPGEATKIMPKGRAVSDSTGSTLFVADTDNNRIVIWENANLRNCLVTLLSDPQAADPEIRDMYIYACYLQSASAPLSAHNILGQPTQYDNMSCQEHNDECSMYLTESTCLAPHNTSGFLEAPSFCQWKNNSCVVKGNQCLTQPTEILYDNGRLIVSDTGNDRVVLYEDILFSPQGGTSDLDLQLIGCDAEIIPNQTRPTKCPFQKVFGKRDADDFTDYGMSAGEATLSNPTGLLVDGEDLYIADTLNNRVVKVDRFYGTIEGGGSDINNFYECNDSSWMTSKCRWSGILGQSNYNQTLSFQDFFDEDPSILTGTFYNIVEDPDLLKRYFRYPTKLGKVVNDNGSVSFLVLANEDFFTISELGTQVALRSRILMFNDIPLKGSSPACNVVSFPLGGCDADSVIGQESFDKLVILSGSTGGAGDYKNVAYGLDRVNDFSINGKDIYAVDYVNNFVYVWKNIFSNTLTGKPFSFKVDNPDGRYVNATIGNLPILKGLTGIHYSSAGDLIFIVDGDSGVIYQLQFLNLNF